MILNYAQNVINKESLRRNYVSMANTVLIKAEIIIIFVEKELHKEFEDTKGADRNR